MLLQAKSKMLLHARMNRHYVYAGKQYWTLSFYTGFRFGRIDLKKNWNTAQRVKQHLFPNCRPSLSCFWLSKGNPSIPLPQSALFFFSPFLLFLLSVFHDGAAEPFPTENYSESLSTAPSQSVPPSLCSLLWGPFPSSSPSGPTRKESSVMALWRENGGIHPMLCRW